MLDSLTWFVSIYAPWIYFVCGIVALYHIYKIWQVRAERRQAVFSLEREKARQDLYNIFVVVMILVFSMGSTYFISTTLAAAIELEVVESTPTPLTFLQFQPTPSYTPLPPTITPTGTPIPIPPTATPEIIEEVPTPVPAPIVAVPVCPDNRAILLSPGNGERVGGVVNITGTATHEQFQYYKVEYAAGAGGQGFAYLTGGDSPVNNGFLGNFNSTTLTNGEWTLQLVVVDQTGNFPPPCQVTIIVQN